MDSCEKAGIYPWYIHVGFFSVLNRKWLQEVVDSFMQEHLEDNIEVEQAI